MKKILLSLFAGTLLLSGCSFGGEKDTKKKVTPSMSEEKATKQAKESPEELFYTLAQANMDYTVEKIKEVFPSKETLLKNKNNTSLVIDANLSATPLQAGTLHIEAKNLGEKDATDETNPLLSQKLSLSGEIKDAMVSGTANSSLELKVVENGLYASVQNLEVNSPMIPQEQIEMITSLFVQKWYGNTFEELNTLAGGEIDFQKLLAGKGLGVILWEIIEDKQSNLKDYVTFIAFKETKDGVSYFDAKINDEKLEKSIQKVLGSIGLSEQAISGVSTEMKASLATISNETISIGLKASDTSFISVEMPGFDMNSGKKIEGKTSTIIYSSSETFAEIAMSQEDTLRFTAKDGKFTLGGDDDKNKNMVLVSGTYSDEAFTFIAKDPDMEGKEGQEKIEGSFTKSKGKWSGEISNTIDSSILIKISDASFEKNAFSITASLEQTPEGGEMVNMGSATLSSKIEPAASVSVEKPANAEPFMNIMQVVGALSGGAQQQGGVLPPQATPKAISPNTMDDMDMETTPMTEMENLDSM